MNTSALDIANATLFRIRQHEVDNAIRTIKQYYSEYCNMPINSDEYQNFHEAILTVTEILDSVDIRTMEEYE